MRSLTTTILLRFLPISTAAGLLGDKAQVRGGVTAEDVVVRGRIIGLIRDLRVTLQGQCHVEGDIFHQGLAVEQGAYFEGKSRRSGNPLEEIEAGGATNSANGSYSASSPRVVSSAAAE
jgi:cytoskeletal protein CcmA (bactofilin family)